MSIRELMNHTPEESPRHRLLLAQVHTYYAAHLEALL